MEGSPKASTVVQMNGEGVVAEDFERFVVMAVHVAGEEVEDGHIHEVQQATILVIRGNVSDHGAVVGVGFPLSLPAFVVGPAPRVSPDFALGIRLGW